MQIDLVYLKSKIRKSEMLYSELIEMRKFMHFAMDMNLLHIAVLQMLNEQ